MNLNQVVLKRLFFDVCVSFKTSVVFHSLGSYAIVAVDFGCRRNIHVAEMVKAQCEQICWECNNLLYGGAVGASVEEDTR